MNNNLNALASQMNKDDWTERLMHHKDRLDYAIHISSDKKCKPGKDADYFSWLDSNMETVMSVCARKLDMNLLNIKGKIHQLPMSKRSQYIFFVEEEANHTQVRVPTHWHGFLSISKAHSLDWNQVQKAMMQFRQDLKKEGLKLQIYSQDRKKQEYGFYKEHYLEDKQMKEKEITYALKYQHHVRYLGRAFSYGEFLNPSFS